MKKVFDGMGFADANEFLEKEIESIIRRDRKIKLGIKYFNQLTCGKFFKTIEVELVAKASLNL